MPRDTYSYRDLSGIKECIFKKRKRWDGWIKYHVALVIVLQNQKGGF